MLSALRGATGVATDSACVSGGEGKSFSGSFGVDGYRIEEMKVYETDPLSLVDMHFVVVDLNGRGLGLAGTKAKVIYFIAGDRREG